jgi:hypothetical protein
MYPRTFAVACVAGLALAGGCYRPEPSEGLPCTASSQCPGGQLCSLDFQICERSSAEMWRLDSAADFAAGKEVGGTVDPDGALSAQRYLYGAVKISAANQLNVPSVRTASWEDITRTSSGTGYLRSVFQPWMNGAPAGVGLDRADGITLWIEGELYLEAGNWQVQLFADDEGLLDIGPPGGTMARLTEATYQGASTVPWVAATTGWYPFRAALTDRNEGLFFLLQAGRQGDAIRQIPADRLRVAVGRQRGVSLESFAGGYVLSRRAVTLAPSVLGVFGDTPPPDLGLTLPNEWSLRYAGQFFVAQAEQAQLSIDSQGGHRLWIDRDLVSNRLGTAAVTAQISPINLRPGWHDLVAEVMKQGPGEGHLQLSVLRGDPDLLAEDRLRPVEGAIHLVGVDATDTLALAAGATVTLALNLVATGAAAVTAPIRAISVGYTASGPLPSISLQLETPGGSIPLRAVGSLTGATVVDYVTTVPVALTTSLSGWKLVVRNTGAVAGTVGPVAMTVEYERPTAVGNTFRYTSSVHELKTAAPISSVRWITQPRNSPLHVEVRTCATSTCDDGQWVDVASVGDAPAAPVNPYVQLRVDGTMADTSSFRLDAIEVRTQPSP